MQNTLVFYELITMSSKLQAHNWGICSHWSRSYFLLQSMKNGEEFDLNLIALCTVQGAWIWTKLHCALYRVLGAGLNCIVHCTGCLELN